MVNRSGKYIRNMSGKAEYYSFCPASLPPMPALDIGENFMSLLLDANCRLVRLDTVSQHIHNAELFVSMYVRKEALISSQIEGTQCTLEDVFDPELDISTNADVGDVINYVKAVQFALERLNTLPL